MARSLVPSEFARVELAKRMSSEPRALQLAMLLEYLRSAFHTADDRALKIHAYWTFLSAHFPHDARRLRSEISSSQPSVIERTLNQAAATSRFWDNFKSRISERVAFWDWKIVSRRGRTNRAPDVWSEGQLRALEQLVGLRVSWTSEEWQENAVERMAGKVTARLRKKIDARQRDVQPRDIKAVHQELARLYSQQQLQPPSSAVLRSASIDIGRGHAPPSSSSFVPFPPPSENASPSIEFGRGNAAIQSALPDFPSTFLARSLSSSAVGFFGRTTPCPLPRPTQPKFVSFPTTLPQKRLTNELTDESEEDEDDDDENDEDFWSVPGDVRRRKKKQKKQKKQKKLPASAEKGEIPFPSGTNVADSGPAPLPLLPENAFGSNAALIKVFETLIRNRAVPAELDGDEILLQYIITYPEGPWGKMVAAMDELEWRDRHRVYAAKTDEERRDANERLRATMEYRSHLPPAHWV